MAVQVVIMLLKTNVAFQGEYSSTTTDQISLCAFFWRVYIPLASVKKTSTRLPLITLTGEHLTFTEHFQSGLSEAEAPQQPQRSENDFGRGSLCTNATNKHTHAAFL